MSLDVQRQIVVLVYLISQFRGYSCRFDREVLMGEHDTQNCLVMVASVVNILQDHCMCTSLGM